jgi:hypothetical protein
LRLPPLPPSNLSRKTAGLKPKVFSISADVPCQEGTMTDAKILVPAAQYLRMSTEHQQYVPGIDEKDIDVRIENNTLTVHGKRKIEKEERGELPSSRAAVWKLHPVVHSAQFGRPGASECRL